MTVIRFFMDPESGQPHIYDHGVTEAEVMELFRNFPITQSGKTSPSGKPSTIATGQTDVGRFLKVIYFRDKVAIGIFVVTAYDLRGKELQAFRRRKRRRNR
jgi:hypothetical protein